MEHLSEEEIESYVLRRAPAVSIADQQKERKRIEEHLLQCDSCRNALDLEYATIDAIKEALL
jgi:predicted anti-sigma-YlaC factor YlaD